MIQIRQVNSENRKLNYLLELCRLPISGRHRNEMRFNIICNFTTSSIRRRRFILQIHFTRTKEEFSLLNAFRQGDEKFYETDRLA